LTNDARKRFVFFGIFGLVALIFWIRIVMLAADPSNYQRAVSNALKKITIYPSRGIIYDRKGELLVYNGPVYDLIVFPRELKGLDTTAFCELLNLPRKEFDRRLADANFIAMTRRRKDNSFNRSATFKSNLSLEEYTRIQENLYQFSGFYLEQKTDRLYNRSSAAHYLGYIGEVTEKMMRQDAYYKSGDLAGITGIESGYESYLRGKKGVRTVFQDRHSTEKGSAAGGRFDSVAFAGPDIYASIDIDLQEFGEKLLAGKTGSIVAIDPATGEILALVNKPDYHPDFLVGPNRSKRYRQLLIDPSKPLYNRAIRGVYPPGSTFKPVMALIARQENVLSPATFQSGAEPGHQLQCLLLSGFSRYHRQPQIQQRARRLDPA